MDGFRGRLMATGLFFFPTSGFNEQRKEKTGRIILTDSFIHVFLSIDIDPSLSDVIRREKTELQRFQVHQTSGGLIMFWTLTAPHH